MTIKTETELAFDILAGNCQGCGSEDGESRTCSYPYVEPILCQCCGDCYDRCSRGA